jgi:hypothetical protein
MLTVNGIYDGEKIYLLEAVEKKKVHKVLVIFLEQIIEAEEWHATRPYVPDESFSFWEDGGED